MSQAKFLVPYYKLLFYIIYSFSDLYVLYSYEYITALEDSYLLLSILMRPLIISYTLRYSPRQECNRIEYHNSDNICKNKNKLYNYLY